MIKIEMPRKELTVAPEVTVGNRKRFSTATAVAFITDTLFVSAAFNSRKLYLVEITAEGHNILQEIKTISRSYEIQRWCHFNIRLSSWRT
jgi:hypothetical protein